MLLLIDAGNTRVKWALAAPDAPPGQWLREGALTHAELDLLAASWQREGITRALASNVAGIGVGEQLQRMLPSIAIEWFASTPQRRWWWPPAAPPPPSTPCRPTAFSSAG
jgi:type III pantothenate kinase